MRSAALARRGVRSVAAANSATALLLVGQHAGGARQIERGERRVLRLQRLRQPVAGGQSGPSLILSCSCAAASR